ncbi:MAG: glycerol-3-phosphate acyltransferase [Chloroflexia bacterium]
MSGPAALLLAAGLGYVAGSIPFGFLTARYIAGVDVRSQGSGKIGATNVRRLLGWKGFFLVMALDLLKGTAAVFAAGLLVDGGVEPWSRPPQESERSQGTVGPFSSGSRGGEEWPPEWARWR